MIRGTDAQETAITIKGEMLT